MTSFLDFIGIELSSVSFKEKCVSAIGGLLSISLLICVTQYALGSGGGMCIVASMGASAVLLFAVPHGQLSQPWPVIAGHVFAALIGVACFRYIPYDWLAAGCSVGLTILMMHQLKCIHPPGGATALTAVFGGEAVHRLGFHYVWFPVLINALIMVGIAILFNWSFKWRRYPAGLHSAHRPHKRHPQGFEPSHEDIVKALRSLDSFVDVTEEDLINLSLIIARERHARTMKGARRTGAVAVSR